MKTFIVLAITLLFWSTTYAGEPDLKPKSETTAWVLALDPIPADSLFYAGRPVQGAFGTLTSLIGAAAIFGGVLFNLEDCSGSEPCILNSHETIYTLFAVGGGLYLGSLIWDGIGGVHYVKKYNAEFVQKKTSFINAFQPTFAVTDKSAMVGAQFRF